MAYNATQILSDRATGLYPISIGTSLALESLFGIAPDAYDREDPNKAIIIPPNKNPPGKHYDAILFNLRTLVRNFINSIPGKDSVNLVAEDIAMSLIGELMYCDELVSRTLGHLERVFYTLDYAAISHAYPLATPKVLQTDKQLFQAKLETECLNIILSHQIPIDKRYYRKSITDNYNRAVVLTHMPVDLLSRHQFELMTLLESHTGKLKTRNEWYTKFGVSNKDELINIPFTDVTLQLFGDGNQLFSPKPIGVRKQFLEASIKGKWIYSTTPDKMRSDVNRYCTDTVIRDNILSLF